MKLKTAILISLLCIPTMVKAADVKLAWEISPGATGYKIHYGTVSKVYTGVVDVGNNLTGTVTNLIPGTTYYFVASAYSATQVSPFSNEVNSLVPIPPLPGPKALRVIQSVIINIMGVPQKEGE